MNFKPLISSVITRSAVLSSRFISISGDTWSVHYSVWANNRFHILFSQTDPLEIAFLLPRQLRFEIFCIGIFTMFRETLPANIGSRYLKSFHDLRAPMKIQRDYEECCLCLVMDLVLFTQLIPFHSHFFFAISTSSSSVTWWWIMDELTWLDWMISDHAEIRDAKRSRVRSCLLPQSHLIGLFTIFILFGRVSSTRFIWKVFHSQKFIGLLSSPQFQLILLSARPRLALVANKLENQFHSICKQINHRSNFFPHQRKRFIYGMR